MSATRGFGELTIRASAYDHHHHNHQLHRHPDDFDAGVNDSEVAASGDLQHQDFSTIDLSTSALGAGQPDGFGANSGDCSLSQQHFAGGAAAAASSTFTNANGDTSNNSSGYTSFGDALAYNGTSTVVAAAAAVPVGSTTSSAAARNVRQLMTSASAGGKAAPSSMLVKSSTMSSYEGESAAGSATTSAGNGIGASHVSSSTSAFGLARGGGGGGGGTSASSMLSTASEASTKLALRTVSTIESLRLWSRATYKCTRQIVSEKLGKANRTVDPELDTLIENLRCLRKKYENLLALTRQMATHYTGLLQTQKLLGDSFAELAQKSPTLIDEFTANADTQRNMCKHGDLLTNSIKMFNSTLSTLCTKTIEDTMLTIRSYESARLEYDANKFDLEQLQAAAAVQKSDSSSNGGRQIAELEQSLAKYKEKYEQLKKDVVVKMNFLDENRVKVMAKQLATLHAAIGHYFAGSKESFEAVMKQLNSKEAAAADKPVSNGHHRDFKFQSFLEEN